jgi:hypothetical protein
MVNYVRTTCFLLFVVIVCALLMWNTEPVPMSDQPAAMQLCDSTGCSTAAGPFWQRYEEDRQNVDEALPPTEGA